MEITPQEIVLADTDSYASPKSIQKIIKFFRNYLPKTDIALHLHDRYSIAIASIYESLESGVTTFESSCGGVGGCPFF